MANTGSPVMQEFTEAHEHLLKALNVSECTICDQLISDQLESLDTLMEVYTKAMEYMGQKDGLSGKLNEMNVNADKLLGTPPKEEKRSNGGGGGRQGPIMGMLQNRPRLTDMFNSGGR